MLRYRIISGCLIGAGLSLAAYYLPAIGIWLLLLAISILAQLEFYAMMRVGGIPVYRFLGTFCGIGLISATFFTLSRAEMGIAEAYHWDNLVLLVSLLVVFVRQFPQRNNTKPLETIGCTLLGIWYVPYLLNAFTRLIFSWDVEGIMGEASVTGRLLALYLIVVVKFGDIGGYFVGRFLGRHKLFPRISPKKTWEGFAGGLAFSLVASIAFAACCGGSLGRLSLRLVDIFALGLLLPMAGMVGDIFESLLKRAAGIKDSSSAIPGMGGILDVIDSLLFGAPVLFIYVRVFLR